MQAWPATWKLTHIHSMLLFTVPPQHPDSTRAGLVCLDGALVDSTKTSSRVLSELDGKVQVYY